MSKQHFQWFYKFIVTISMSMIAVSFFSIVWVVGPILETKFAPVVNKLVITDLKEGEVPGTSSFVAEFTKVRGNCEYLGIGWYDDSDVRLPITLFRTATDTDGPNRPAGFTRTGPWVVAIPPDQLEQKSHAVLYHRCHPFWVTVTEFYP